MCPSGGKSTCSFLPYEDVCHLCTNVLRHIDKRFVQMEMEIEKRLKDRRTSRSSVDIDMRQS